MALTLDRKSFIDILSEGQAKIGGAMLPPPAGLWGMPPELLSTIPGYDPDVQKNRRAAQEIMHKLGYGTDTRLALKVATRNINSFRDPAIILIDQLKEIYIDGELDHDRDRQLAFQSDAQGLQRSAQTAPAAASTTPTSSSTKTTHVARTAITAAIAIRNSTKSSTGNRPKPIRKNARSSCGRSTASCRRMALDRSSFTASPRPAGSRK